MKLTDVLVYEPIAGAEPMTWEPPQTLADQAFALHAELIRLGEEARPAREEVVRIWKEQGRILSEFYLNNDLCKALGCEGGWAEYFMQDDVRLALGISSQASKTQRSRMCRLLIHSYYSNINLLEDDLKSRAAAGLPKLDRLAKAKEDAERQAKKDPAAKPQAQAAQQEYQETVERFIETSYREVYNEVSETRPALFHAPPNGKGVGLYDTVDGDLAAIVKLSYPIEGSFLLSRLLREKLPTFHYDRDGIGFYTEGGEWVQVVKFKKRFSVDELRQIAARIPNCQERLT